MVRIPEFCYLKVVFFSGDDDDSASSEKNKKSSRSLSGNVCSSKEEFKGHLNGLYSGLANIMKTTCNIESSKSTAPFAVEKAVHNIMFIKHHMKRQDEFDAVSPNKLFGLLLCHTLSHLRLMPSFPDSELF